MNEKQVQLAPPGAGLPKIELFVARFRLWRAMRQGNRESFNATFNQQRAAIRNLYQSCDPDTAVRRVLIKRLRGLEDSSRNWSVWMTLDHLRIVNQSFGRVISHLGRGIVPAGKASTAAVKPSADVTASVVQDYEASCDSLLAAVAAIPNLRTPVRYAHPWFGPLDAFGWHALAGGHMRIHYGQIQQILQTMNG
jgi:hypothetical protein